MSFFQSLGQTFTNLITEIKDYFAAPGLFSWMPLDIRTVVAALLIVLLLVAIKRAVMS